MQDSGPSDPELLSAWLDQRSESSFHALVARYAGLVHATARRTCGDESMASEVSQLTFITLARRAESLASCCSLGGWLHRTALLQSRNVQRQQQRERRKRQTLQSAMETPSTQAADNLWKEMQPVLDDALGELADRDREILLLRFYRQLSVREVAAVMGIATEAAQKRIQRATERLREKLVRRGVQTGGSFASVMLAGFAADAQAAVPGISLMASKALAAGAAGTGLMSGGAVVTTATFMKSTTWLVPLAVLLAGGGWIVSQRRAIAGLERQSGLLQEQLDRPAVAAVPQRRTVPVASALEGRPVDWERVARQLRSDGGAGYLQTDLALKAKLEEGFAAMGVEELTAALDEIARAGLSRVDLDLLEGKLGGLLLEKDPELGLNRFIGRVHEQGSSPFSWLLSMALGNWAKRDPDAAVAWFDRQIAEGSFDSPLLSGSPYARIKFEHDLIFALLSSAPEKAGGRLEGLPEDQRRKALQGVGVGRAIYGDEKLHLPFAELIRRHLPEKDRLNVIAWPVIDLGETGTIGYGELAGYFERTGAGTEEREACILAVAGQGRFPRGNDNVFDTQTSDLDALRAWVAEEAPGLEDRATARALKSVANQFSNEFPRWAEYAKSLHEAGGGDELLIPLLEAHNAAQHRELARTLAGRLSEEELRERYLKHFK